MANPNLPPQAQGDFDPLAVAQQHEAAFADPKVAFESEWLGMHDGGTPNPLAEAGEEHRPATAQETHAAARDTRTYFEGRPDAPEEQGAGVTHMNMREFYDHSHGMVDGRASSGSIASAEQEAERLAKTPLDRLLDDWASANNRGDRNASYPIAEEVRRRVFKNVPEDDPKYNEATRHDEKLARAEERFAGLLEVVNRRSQARAESGVDAGIVDGLSDDAILEAYDKDKSFLQALDGGELNKLLERRDAILANRAAELPTPEPTPEPAPEPEPEQDPSGTTESDPVDPSGGEGDQPEPTPAPDPRPTTVRAQAAVPTPAELNAIRRAEDEPQPDLDTADADEAYPLPTDEDEEYIASLSDEDILSMNVESARRFMSPGAFSAFMRDRQALGGWVPEDGMGLTTDEPMPRPAVNGHAGAPPEAAPNSAERRRSRWYQRLGRIALDAWTGVTDAGGRTPIQRGGRRALNATRDFVVSLGGGGSLEDAPSRERARVVRDEQDYARDHGFDSPEDLEDAIQQVDPSQHRRYRGSHRRPRRVSAPSYRDVRYDELFDDDEL